ncbi:MAG: hypothetical protein ACOC0U_06190 [Desulfovibrionales bacterium]
MRKSRYTLLFIRNDSSIRRFRLTPFFLLLTVLGSILLMSIAVGGSYVGYLFWVKYHSLRESQDRLQKQLVQKESRLNRLENLEKFLHSFDPEKLEVLLGMNSGSSPGEANKPAEKEAPAYVDVDRGVVRLSNLDVSSEGENIRLAFRILTVDQGTPTSGRMRVQLIGQEGTAIAVKTDAVHGGTSYRIRRFKDMDLKVPLPVGSSMKDIAFVRLLALDEKETLVLSKTVELNS